MSVSMQDVRKVLDPDEPDYDAAAALGADALPHLQALVEGNDSMLAAKAAYAAGMLEGDQGSEVIRTAAQSDRAVVRVAAASAAGNLPGEAAAPVLTGLAADPDAGVRKVALDSVPDDAPEGLVAELRSGAAEAAGRSGQEDDGGETPPGLMPGEASRDSAAEPGLMPGERA